MTAAYTLTIYEILQPVIKNEQKTKELVQNIEMVIDERFEEKKSNLATKEDIRIVEKSITDSFKWLVGIMITLFGLTITIMFFLIKSKI